MLNISKYFLFIIVLFSLNLFANNSLEKVKLQLQWKHQFEFAGFYAAKEKGFYKDLGMDVEFLEFDGEKDIVDSILDEKAEFGLGYSSIIADYSNGKRISFVANYLKQSPLVLITREDIKTPT